MAGTQLILQACRGRNGHAPARFCVQHRAPYLQEMRHIPSHECHRGFLASRSTRACRQQHRADSAGQPARGANLNQQTLAGALVDLDADSVVFRPVDRWDLCGSAVRQQRRGGSGSWEREGRARADLSAVLDVLFPLYTPCAPSLIPPTIAPGSRGVFHLQKPAAELG